MPAFRALFRKSPVKRIGRDRFLRNVLIAIGNSGDAALATEAEALAGRSLAAGARRGGVGAAAPAAARRIRRPGRRSRRPKPTPTVRAEWSQRLGCRRLHRASARPLRAASAVSPPPAILSAAWKSRRAPATSPASRAMSPRSTSASAELGLSFSAASASSRAAFSFPCACRRWRAAPADRRAWAAAPARH